MQRAWLSAAIILAATAPSRAPATETDFDFEIDTSTRAEAALPEAGTLLAGSVRVGARGWRRSLDGVTHLAGDLILGAGVDALCLPHLKVIGGDLRLRDAGALAQVKLPALQEVGGSLELSGSRTLDRVKLPALRAVRGSVLLRDNHALEAFELPQLSPLQSELIVEGNPRLRRLAMAPAGMARGPQP